jgi:hypothetical protein
MRQEYIILKVIIIKNKRLPVFLYNIYFNNRPIIRCISVYHYQKSYFMIIFLSMFYASAIE